MVTTSLKELNLFREHQEVLLYLILLPFFTLSSGVTNNIMLNRGHLQVWLHLFKKVLLSNQYEIWTVRHNAILGRWQACYSVSFTNGK